MIHTGHVLLHQMKEEGEGDGLAACERLRMSGSDEVAPATHWLVFARETPWADVVAAATAFSEKRGEGPTVFWSVDHAVRPADAESDLAKLEARVATLAGVVVVVESPAPRALACARCARDLYSRGADYFPDESRRRRGRDPRRQIAATPRPRRGHSVEAATPRPRRG